MTADQLKRYRASLRTILDPATNNGELCEVIERWIIQELIRVANALEHFRPPRTRSAMVPRSRYTNKERRLIQSTRYQDIQTAAHP